MSKTLDLSDLSKLSQDDIVYALSHNLLDARQRAELDIADEDVRGIIHGEVNDYNQPNTGYAGPRVDAEEYEAYLEWKRQKAEDELPKFGKEGLEAVETEGDDYEDMTNAELRAAIHDRTNGEGDVTGNKAELQARLRALDKEGE